jgi:transposase InsO family protein
VENHTWNRIKVLRLGNGGEYNSNEFKDFYKEEGIKRELKVSYNPQQNGVVERENRSIIGSAKTITHDQELPMFL